MKRIFLLLSLVVWTCETLASPTQIPAFPGAEGFGKYSVGGRGGDVYCVTNLKDAGVGSLRYGIQSAQGPRTIVFEVAGTIVLKSPLTIKGKSHLTLAGQTAPGKGITLRDQNFSIQHSQHIIVRYLRVRLGDENKETGSGPDVMTVDYNDQIILDHLSLSWGIDGNSDYRGNKNMTLQWLIYSEALNRSLHRKGAHAMATSLRDCFGNTSVHHNIYTTSRNRHPTIGSGVEKGGANWIVDFRNCVNYNWSGRTNLGGVQMNVIGNYYRPGPCTIDSSVQPFRIKDHDTTHGKGDRLMSKPNNLWISNHDSSAWNYGCYGDRYAHTPNIDRLAAEGVRYANAFTASPICSPPRTSIYTGMHPTTLGTHHHRRG